MNSKPSIYIPIEIKKRELTSQILLASVLVEKGFRVYIGTHAAIHSIIEAKRTTAGIYFDKSTPIPENCSNLKRKVTKIYVLDQELSPVLSNEKKETSGASKIERLFADRVPVESIDYIDIFITQGEPYTVAAAKLFGPQRVLELGWPRFDLLHPKYFRFFSDRVDEIKYSYGNFALFVSNFPYIENVDRLTKSKHSATKLIQSYGLEDYRKDIRDLEGTINCLRDWKKKDLEGINLIIRPHPGEKKKMYKDALKGLPNVFIDSRFEIYPWIYACEFLIHRGSTSSFQALFASKEVYFIEEGDTENRFEFRKSYSTGLFKSTNGVYFERFSKERQDAQLDLMTRRVKNFGHSTNVIVSQLCSEFIPPEPALRPKDLIFRYIRPRALRRAFGLLRDEFLYAFGLLDVVSQLKKTSGGIYKKEIRAILFGLRGEDIYRVRRIGINLFSIETPR